MYCLLITKAFASVPIIASNELGYEIFKKAKHLDGYRQSNNLSASQRENEGVDFFNIQRKDKSYRASVSLWKRDWHWKGFTPRLTTEWSKTDSNHFYYDNKEDTDVYIEVSKEF